MFEPVIAPAVDGSVVRKIITLQTCVPTPQVLLGVTQTFPETALAAKLTLMDAVPCPETILAPAGTVQLKVTPACGVTLYKLFVVGRQKLVGPVAEETVGAFPTVTIIAFDVELPHVFATMHE